MLLLQDHHCEMPQLGFIAHMQETCNVHCVQGCLFMCMPWLLVALAAIEVNCSCACILDSVARLVAVPVQVKGHSAREAASQSHRPWMIGRGKRRDEAQDQQQQPTVVVAKQLPCM